MNIYTLTDFTGHWPVGTSALVIAETPGRAAQLLEKRLAEIGLEQSINVSDLTRHQADVEGVFILQDGDY